MTAEYYVSMLKTDVMPRVATVVAEGGRFCFQQDLASPHTAAPTTEYLKSKGVELAPWLSLRADLGPHGHLRQPVTQATDPG